MATSKIKNASLDTGIDAAKLADGSTSNAELQYINSLSSNAQTQITAGALPAVGASGNVLTSDGSNWASAEAGGGGVFGNPVKGTVSGVSEIVFSNLTSTTKITLSNITTSNTTYGYGLSYRLSSDNGSSWYSDYYTIGFGQYHTGSISTVYNASNAWGDVYSINSSATATHSMCGEWIIHSPESSNFTITRSHVVGIDNNNGNYMELTHAFGGIIHKTATAINAVKFFNFPMSGSYAREDLA